MKQRHLAVFLLAVFVTIAVSIPAASVVDGYAMNQNVQTGDKKTTEASSSRRSNHGRADDERGRPPLSFASSSKITGKLLEEVKNRDMSELIGNREFVQWIKEWTSYNIRDIVAMVLQIKKDKRITRYSDYQLLLMYFGREFFIALDNMCPNWKSLKSLNPDFFKAVGNKKEFSSIDVRKTIKLDFDHVAWKESLQSRGVLFKKDVYPKMLWLYYSKFFKLELEDLAEMAFGSALLRDKNYLFSKTKKTRSKKRVRKQPRTKVPDRDEQRPSSPQRVPTPPHEEVLDRDEQNHEMTVEHIDDPRYHKKLVQLANENPEWSAGYLRKRATHEFIGDLLNEPNRGSE
ncbi:hypothetical protein PsorP6_013080 [Peronosclerospora sorghi]|uniref:Uncharacterized protein n=1 Tax=Peronosclerospora sorghi TaxID=230839 RepID=A0ACC0WJJ4_9STRA|nr:hypothetical protein PsorP6_013080 [Peronosclerospora sorghi]